MLTKPHSVAYDGPDGADGAPPDDATEYSWLIRATDGGRKDKVFNSGASIPIHLRAIISHLMCRTCRPRKISFRIRFLAQSIHVGPPKTRQETGKTSGGGTREEEETDRVNRRFWTKERCRKEEDEAIDHRGRQACRLQEEGG